MMLLQFKEQTQPIKKFIYQPNGMNDRHVRNWAGTISVRRKTVCRGRLVIGEGDKLATPAENGVKKLRGLTC